MDKYWSDKNAKPGGAGRSPDRQGAAGLGGTKSGTAGRLVMGHDDSSDYSDDWGGDEDARQTKQQLENKKQLQQIQEGRAGAGGGAGADDDFDAARGDPALDALWASIREELHKVVDAGGMGASSGPAQTKSARFADACRVYDTKNVGFIAMAELRQAFAQARVQPRPEEEELERIVTALEAWHKREAKTVHYGRFLDATRGTVSSLGFFPKQQPRGPTPHQRAQKAKAEEEEQRKREAEAEQRKAREAPQQSKRLTASGGRGLSSKAQSKDEQKRQQREEQQRREFEKKEAERLQKEEDDAVKVEVQKLKAVVGSLRNKVDAQGEDVRAWFRLFDRNKNSRLGLPELEEVLRRANARPGKQELANMFRLLDTEGDGRVTASEFCDVLEGKKIPDYEAHVRAERQRAKKQEAQDAERRAMAANIRSMGADAGSTMANPESLGRVDGLSSIMESMVAEPKAPVKLLDDEASLLRVQAEIKELLSKDASGKPRSFDDVLQLMDKPAFTKEGQVALADFEAAVRGAGGRTRFSAHEVRQVFDSHAVDPPKQGAGASISGTAARFIPVRDFKDKFLPSLTWHRDVVTQEMAASQRTGSQRSGSGSRTESMQIDDVLAGKRPADVAKEKEAIERERAKKKAQPPAAQLAPVMERDFDGASQADSRASLPVDQVMPARGADPKRKNTAKQAAAAAGGLNQATLDKFNAEQRVNEQYYRQPQAVVKRVPVQEDFEYDKSLEHFFQVTCKALAEEVRSGRPRGVDSYVEAYGKESPGFLVYPEFKEVFMTHAHPIGAPPPEEGKILALFNLFDVQSRGKIAKADFVATLQRTKPAVPIVDRLASKVRKGGERLVRALTEEFQEADAPFGCHGELPLKNFQVILADYDLPVLEADLAALEKGGYIERDDADCRYVRYNAILSQVAERGRGLLRDPSLLARVVVKIQAAWRGAQARREIAARGQLASADLRAAGEAMDALRGGPRPLPDALEKPQDGKKAKADPKKKKDAPKAGKDRRKEPESLESKLAAVVRQPKESRLQERQSQARQAIADWLRTTVVDHMVEAAFCYGESLGVCRNIQRRFETRPVTKYLFPMMQAFQFPVQGVLPKSLQTVNRLGQLMCLDAENQLNQFDVATTASLQSVNLGTKPPLRHYNIIDLVCDQASGRIYTLNANWILEIWSIEQNASFPQKRLAVCANEGGKDFIHLYYPKTFNNSKPRFLSLQESNQQVLVVNTTCVDGSIVFIDPISFSVLKKIQLRYSDYEVPKAVRDSISQLRKIFDGLRENQGKDVAAIFAGITHPDTQEVKIKDFVAKLARQDPTLREDDLYKCCSVLDRDGNGSITLDEFLEFFGDVEDSEADLKAAEEELQDEMWPDWLIKEGQLSTAQGLLTKMHTVLDREHGITAEEAFGVYDIKDTGDCSVDEFRRILKIFFGEVFSQDGDLEFLMRLAQPRASRVDYRDFCKYLSKRAVRAFKSAPGPAADGQDGGKSGAGPLRELETPLQKEATLTYVLRKAAELELDVRKRFLDHDKNELNVIPRSRFVGLLLDLPLGINEVDVQEILENDLNFDNYGNVDYTAILNSDLFCHLERARLKAAHKKRKGVRVAASADDEQGAKPGQEPEKVDNRKVVVEDLIYIDDLEILIYTTVAPKMSTAFITSVKKSPGPSTTKMETKIMTLQTLGGQRREDDKKDSGQDGKSASLMTNYYQLLAKLKGHKNNSPPSICYVPHSCCLVTGEKHLDEGAYAAPRDTYPAAADPTVPSSHKFQKSSQDAYEKHQARGQQGQPCELLIWNLQRDLIELFQSRPPWTVPCHRRIPAHNSSILDICYLAKSQLVVTTSTDQTIKFFDPISTSYELTDASNNPHAQMRPGHYLPLQKERTRTNTTFKEVKRIYAGSDTSCFALRSLHIQGIVTNPSQPEVKSQMEWLVALKLGKPQWQQNRNTQVGFLCGYGIERVQIEVPALHHDDIVPPFVLKECEELVLARRRRLVAAFQQSLQQTITKIFSQVQLQESFINKIRQLFMKAVLQRKELKYVNSEPLREIYKLILKLPDRTKFQSFLASSGCSDKLSVSETFFYLQKFQQIHPLRTTQIEFERSIQEFHDKHQRQFLQGIKRWPKQSVQRFADHLRRHGLDLVFLQTGKRAGKRFSHFCTRERFVQYFEEVVKSQGGQFSELEADSILNDLDPFFTGVVQLRLLQNVYHEEIQFHKRTSLSRPNEILDDIRTAVFPNRRVALQQALASVDAEGDGYLHKPQFVQAFQQAGVKFDRDTLEFLYDVLSESYTLPKTNYEPSHPATVAEEAPEAKVLSLKFFLGKLFRVHETREVNEVEQTLSNIKAALVYKGLDFSVVFAEQSEEATQKTRRATKLTKEERQQREKERAEAEKKREQNVDLTVHYTRFAQVLGKEAFCRRVESLQAPHVTPAKVQRLAAFLALNQKNESTIYLNSWLHHLRRAGTAFQEADKRVLPLVCAKLVRNERVLRSWLDSCGQIRGAREEDKFIQLADLRQVLTKFGVSYINQDMFLKEFTRGEQIHVEDLIGRLQSVAHRHYQMTGQVPSEDETEPQSVAELRGTDYFRKVQHQLAAAGVELDAAGLVRQYKTFDGARTGYIKAYILVNVLKHNYPSVFSDDCLLGLQFQLECLSSDGTVDYEDFVKLFLEDSGKAKPAHEIRVDRKTPFTEEEYTDLLSNINSHAKAQGLDLKRIFDIFSKQGFVSFTDIGKILDLIEFAYSEHQLELLKRYADGDEGNLDSDAVLAESFLNQILMSEELAPICALNRWTAASRALDGRVELLEVLQGSLESIISQAQSMYGDSEGKPKGVLTADDFAELLGEQCPNLSESDRDRICLFAVKGSRRVGRGEDPSTVPVDIRNGLVQVNHLAQVLGGVLQEMRHEAVTQRQNMMDGAKGEAVARIRQQKDEDARKRHSEDAAHFGMAQTQRQHTLQRTVVALFQERDVSFFDCFQGLYDPLNPGASFITVGEFKKRIRQLNLPLSVQEQRILRRIADPLQHGKVEIRPFCRFFETPELRQRRLHKILDKVATAFFLQGFNMRRAFALFDTDGDGSISAKEFRQGMAALNLHLRFDEIEELMQICAASDGSVSYDEFISKMDLNIKNRSGQVMEKVEEAFFEKLGQAMEYSQDTLLEVMQEYDFERDGTIDAKDLPKVIKKLGIMSPEPHIPHVLRAGRCLPQDKRIDYADFSRCLEAEIARRKKKAASVAQRQMQRVSAILKAKEMSLFDFFVMVDVNQSGTASRLEFKTGVQQLGLSATAEEVESLWTAVRPPTSQVPHQSTQRTKSRGGRTKNRLEPGVEQVAYLQVLKAFAAAGCLKLQAGQEHGDTLLSKFRAQLKRSRVSVEKAYKIFDPQGFGSVQKKDFVQCCLSLGLNFSEDDLVNLFTCICAQGTKKSTSNDQQTQQAERPVASAGTRFNYKQLQEAVLVQRDENWLFQACIKIHSVVLQKGLSYRRLFNQWRDKQSKTQAGRLTESELAQGLKKLKAGLTGDEIEKLCGSLQYDGKDTAISAADFEHEVKEGARKLETARSFERMILQDWIGQFNDCLAREGSPIERLFYEHDAEQVGGLAFEHFAALNEQLGLCMHRKDLQRIFGILDRQGNKRVRLDDMKGVASLIESEAAREQEQLAAQEEEGVKGLTGADLLRRQELNDVYENVKETLESQNVTLDKIIFEEEKYQPNQLATVKAVQRIFQKLDIVLRQSTVEQVLQDVRQANQGGSACSFKTFVDFMTRRRINVAFVDKGFVDPLIAQCCQHFARAKDIFGLDWEQLFDLFDGERSGRLSQEDFLICAQGLEADIAVEDLKELFNYVDAQQANYVTKLQFVDALTYVTNKLGGQSALDSRLNKGLAQAKRGPTSRQAVLDVLKNVAKSVVEKQLEMRQVIQIVDVHRRGEISRAELSQVLRGLCDSITLEQSRRLHLFFDEAGTGSISVPELVGLLQDLINQQVGAGAFAFRQVQPIINKIINELAIDADNFFDEVADQNAAEMKEEAGDNGKRTTASSRDQVCGLSKRLFFRQLAQYGVSLSEQDKAALCQVFGLDEAPDKLDYLKLDQAFEGEQQTLYAQRAFYTVQWERRVFKKIGEYLRRNSVSVEACFDLMDDDGSKTVSKEELKRALIRFKLDLPQTQLEAFLDRVTGSGKESYISREAFIRRFWAAYTYDDVSTEEEMTAEAASSILPEGFSSAADRGRIATGLQQKLRGLKMLKAIQERVTSNKTSSEAFGCLDAGVGFLTLRDFHAGLSQHFDLTLKQPEMAALFREVDRDGDGIVKFEEFDHFYREDYKQRVQALEQEKERMITQYDIFDHLLKVLRQQGRTLEDMFEAIDLDKNQFIEVDEFHQTLEGMGFLITEEQVFELMRQMDENFDGRISFNELKAHILRLGFECDRTLESRSPEGPAQQQTVFQWRDKGLELIISALAKKLGGKTYEQYLAQYDADHDGHLTPPEFRQSLLSLREAQLGRPQMERMLHVLLEERKAQPLVSIERMSSFLRSYKCIDEESGKAGGGSLLIDEDLFVYIVERYDGFSRLLEQFNAVEDRAQYISRHTHEINLRGLDMLANQMNLEKIHRRAQAVNGLYESTLILLAGEANRIIRDEAQLCVLDPTYSINSVVNATGLGALEAVGVPTIENSSFDVDHNTMESLPSGAQRFLGSMGKTKKKVEVLTYGHECLGVVSSDGKVYRRHLQVELRVHRYLMGTLREDDDEPDPESADIFPNIGKFEEKKGPTAGHTDVSVVNELIDQEQWINLDDFVTRNGGILNIPLFFHTDAPLFIARHWAKMVLKIIQKVHDVSAVLRCLQLGQVWVSRDGQRIKLGHVRGVAKVDNFGHLSSCPDIYLNLENTAEVQRAGQSSTQSPGRKTGAASSSKKTDGVRHFSNACLDNPFIAPEALFLKYLDQSAALDVWSFGMIMYCILLGKKPRSFYATYRAWYKKCHGHDVEMAALPFIAPSTSNFLYDPFGVELENDPTDADDGALAQSGLLDIQGSLKEKQGGKLSFENFIKCLKNMSYSSLYTQENSKKFHFKSVAEQMRENGISPDDQTEAPKYPGQQMTNQESRLRAMQAFAKAGVLARKNELGLILDLISSCLDLDPKRRPTIPGLLSSPLFSLDEYELTKAIRFSQNVIVYRAPQSTVTQRITLPLRSICAHAIRQPDRLVSLEEDILKLFAAAEDCIAHISSLPLDDINAVLTEKEKRRALLDPQRSAVLKGKDFSRLCVSPNGPLAAQVIEDQVIDMLIFLTFRYTKAFEAWKLKASHEIASNVAPSKAFGAAASQTEGTRRSKSGTQGATERTQQSQYEQTMTRGSQKKTHNYVLLRMTRLLKTLVYEMHSYSTPMAPYVKEVVEYVVRMFVGEEYTLGSDCVLRRTAGSESSLADYLRGRSFFRKDSDLGEDFKSDMADKAWHLEQRNLSFLDKSNHWSLALHQEANKIFKDAISESGMGQSCYPVLNDYISNVSNSFEPSKIFSKQMNQLSLSYLIPMSRTTAYYNELTPIAECLSRLYSPELEKAGKRCALAMVRSVFQTGSSDKIKACLDLRVPKHVIHFLQDGDSEVRKECLLTLLEISKGLQDEDFEIMGKSAANLKQEYSRRGFKKTAFDQHKAISMASQSEGVEAAEQDQDVPMEGAGSRKTPQTIPQATADGYSNYIKRTIALIEKNENERFINFALDLPNLNFLASKRFLREMAVCFESPVFIAPLTRLLKTKTETHQNKVIILQIMENLFCGNERVLTALNSPASDSYMTLLRLLMQNTKTQNARANPSGLTAQMRNHLFLQDKAVALFVFMFEQRRPTIIRDLSCIGAASTLLREAGLKIPVLISLPDTVAFFDKLAEVLDEHEADQVATKINELILSIQDLRCWVKHFYEQSSIPELTKIKALQRCCSVLVKVVGLVWDDYKLAAPERRLEYLQFIKICLQLFDWLCIRGKENFLFNEECGRTNLQFLLDRCTRALSQFRAPQDQVQLPLEDLAFDTAQNKKAQAARKYDMFPFTEIGAILQNILYQLVRKDSRFVNRLLAEANFGFVFGEQLILEYDFVRHCIDNKIESLVLIDSYVKKNEIRLNTFEYLLRSSEVALKDQLLQSAFMEKLFEDYVHDFREFNIQFSKIDLEFLAFRRSFPVRLECISLINTVLMLKQRAPRVFAELVMYARRHFLIKQELDLLRRGRLGNRESTAILLFAIILESNEEDLIHVLMQEGAPEVLRVLIRDHPSLGRKFPIIEAFTSPF